MITERIAELARATGAQVADNHMPPTEVTEIQMGRDGRLQVRTGNGDQFTVCLDEDVPEGADLRGALTTRQLLAVLVPQIVHYGGRLPAGIPFYRCTRVECGVRVVEFREAGR